MSAEMFSESSLKPAAEFRGGRPNQYNSSYCQAIIDFFERGRKEEYSENPRPIKDLCTTATEYLRETAESEMKTAKRSQKEEVRFICAELPTLEGFARNIGVSRQTVLNWAKLYPSFNEAVQMAKDIQCDLLTQRMLTKRYDSHAAQFVAKNVTWMRDRSELIVDTPQPDPPPHLRHVPIEVLDEVEATLLATKRRLLEAAGVQAPQP